LHQTQLRNRGEFSLAPFRQPDNLRAVWQLCTALAPTALLWACLPWIWRPLRLESLLTVPAVALLVLFSARSFSLMHDCGHGSFFEAGPLTVPLASCWALSTRFRNIPGRAVMRFITATTAIGNATEGLRR